LGFYLFIKSQYFLRSKRCLLYDYQVIAYLDMQWLEDLPNAFDQLVDVGKVPVSRSI
jgi:hypothetical protein